jgi:protein-tyrosine phosphatase
MFTDIHSHILCGVDDGPEFFEQSLALLKAAVQNGVGKLIVTPHFYPTIHSLSDHLKLTKGVFIQLNDYAQQNNIPISLLRGFEVRYFKGISLIDSLDLLCINNSKVLLLELPRAPITEKVIDEILKISYAGYIVVLAHLERYVKMSGFKMLKQLIIDGEVLVQCNASSFIKGKYQRAAYQLLKENLVDFIASDMHSTEKRPPLLKEAYAVISKKMGREIAHRLMLNSENIFDKCL